MMWFDWVGAVGVMMLISTYFLMITDLMDPKGFYYSFFNLLVAIFVGVSLMYRPNYASIVIEVFWAFISMVGIIRYILRKKRSKYAAFGMDPS